MLDSGELRNDVGAYARTFHAKDGSAQAQCGQGQTDPQTPFESIV